MASETTIKGELACLKLEQRAIEKGAVVSRPTIECEYDRVVDYDGKLYRVQVKYADSTSSNASGAVQACIGKAGTKHGSHTPYTDNDIDVVAVYLPAIDRVCWLNREEWQGKVAIQLRFEEPKNNQKKGIRLAEDYVW